MVLSPEFRWAKFAFKSWRYADAFVAHMPLQVTFTQIIFTTNHAEEAFTRRPIAIQIHCWRACQILYLSELIENRIQMFHFASQISRICVYVHMNEWMGVFVCLSVCVWFLWMWLCVCEGVLGYQFFCSVIKCVSRGETIERKKRKKRKTNNDEMKIRFNTTTTKKKRKIKWGRNQIKSKLTYLRLRKLKW